MTGRARGRSRGRGSAPQDAPNPGGASVPQQAQQQPGPPQGRGRSRGAPPPQQQQQAPARAAPRPDVAPPTQQMQQMRMGEQRPSTQGQGDGDRRQRRRLDAREDDIVIRPEGRSKEGTGGTIVDIASNFFKVVKTPRFTGLFQYSVSFEPECNSVKLKSALLHNLDDILGDTRCFDGMTMFLPRKLPEAVTTRQVTSRQGNAFTVKIMFTNEIADNSPQILQIMNIIFKKQLKALNMQQIQRNYFNPSMKIEVQAHKMEVWPGFSTSILQYERNVMLCADVQHKVLRQQSVLDDIVEIRNKVRNDEFFNAVTKKLVGETVITRYNNKHYKIDDIDWNKNPMHTFMKGDKEMTLKDYYEQSYDKKIQDLGQPLLVSIPKARDRKAGMTGNILLLPEFCSIAGLSEEVRANFSIMKDLSQHTRISPAGRAQSLTKLMEQLARHPDSKKELERWNLQFDHNLLKMKGRSLPAEMLAQRDATYSYKIHEADWSREMRSKKLISTINLSKWVLVYSQRDQQVAAEFKQTIQKVCGPMGMMVADPNMCCVNRDDARSYFSAIKDQVQPDTQMVVCIVPNNRKDRYDAIKKLCCVEKPVPSQVAVSRTLSKKNMMMSVCTKIGIQLNCKLGGEVWAVGIPVSNMMVVGFDVFHDSAQKGKSIGGFVASYNKNLTRYYSRITQQSSHQEIADQLKVCMTGALRKYNEINNDLPSRIVFYRDGVGDGQLRQVFEHELPQLKAAFDAIPNFQPKFTMIIVKKRISTRLFHESNGQYSNPVPGTIVDTEVTRPQWFDFFLVSQSVRQGTVTPTHYNIVYDTNGWKPQNYQALTYKLCHLYYNWPGTIRVPAPCQYAHKLAQLVGQSIHTEPDMQLADRLYYL